MLRISLFLWRQRYGNIIPLQGDITSHASLLSLVETVKHRTGYINLLVNNAGVAHNKFKPWDPATDIKAFQESLWSLGTPDEWARTFAVNVTAVYYTTVAFLELLHLGNVRACGEGVPTSQVITMSSVGGFRRDDRVFSLSYGVSKAAVTHLGKSLANILRGWKIRSNVIAPGIYPSGKLRTAIAHQERKSNLCCRRDDGGPGQQDERQRRRSSAAA